MKLLVLMLLFSQYGFAKELSWQQCVSLASENNSQLKSATNSYQSTEELESVARSGFLPTVTGGLNFTRQNRDFSDAQSGNSYAATLTASQNLFNGFQDKAKWDQAKANTRASKAS
jgi:outer membrane protein TolC